MSGAAARAWHLMLKGCRVDPRFLVIGQVRKEIEKKTEKFELAAVESDGVKTKIRKVCAECRAAAKAGREFPLDRIAVVGEENRIAAQAAVDQYDLGEWLDVVAI